MLRFKRHDRLQYDEPSCLFGYVIARHAELTATFGEPCEETSDGEKVAVEWVLTFEDGTYATIYSYTEPSGKTPKVPTGRYQWHIGGQSHYSVLRVAAALCTHEYEIVSLDPLVKGEIPF